MARYLLKTGLWLDIYCDLIDMKLLWWSCLFVFVWLVAPQPFKLTLDQTVNIPAQTTEGSLWLTFVGANRDQGIMASYG